MASAPKAPSPPPFFPINIAQTMQDAMNYDVGGFNMSDADMAQRFPGLVLGRQADITDAYNQLNGPLDPAIQSTFVKGGLSGALGTVGGGDSTSGMGLQKGSFGANSASASVARNVLDKQDSDRSYFESLIAANPQRAFGLSGADVANLNIANTGGLNASNQQAYVGQVQGAIAQGQANVAQAQMISSAVAGLAGIASRYYSSHG